MPPPPELMDELVEEILLRFPPEEPARLVRAALVCKRWRRLISDSAFSRRFREFHRTPLMLGFLYNHLYPYNIEVARFVRTTSFVPTAASTTTTTSSPCDNDYRFWRVDDARHGRVLLSRQSRDHVLLMVWDPINNQQQELPALEQPLYNMKAAIVCVGAATGTCDHLDCYRAPFLVVCMSTAFTDLVTCIYSSDVATWSKTVPMHFPRQSYYINFVQSVLVRKSLYFMFCNNYEVLEYDLQLCKVVSVIQLPQYPDLQRLMLITTEDGELGYATVIGYKLDLWSRKKTDSKGDAGWSQSRVIDLDGLLCATDATTSPEVVGFADGFGAIFLKMNDVFFTIDLKTYETKKVYSGRAIYGIFPYMSFCTPALRGRSLYG